MPSNDEINEFRKTLGGLSFEDLNKKMQSAGLSPWKIDTIKARKEELSESTKNKFWSQKIKRMDEGNKIAKWALGVAIVAVVFSAIALYYTVII